MNEEAALESVVNFLVDETSLEKLPEADAIFVFGHIDPRIPKHAARLFKLGKAPKIVVTGKGRKEISGYRTEAQFFADILKQEDIPEWAVILEEEAMNTVENVKFGMGMCERVNFHPKRLIAVALPPMLRRARATFERQFPELIISGSTFALSLEEYRGWSKRLVEEFDRFDPYFEKGDIAKITVPHDVEMAVNILRDASFTQTSSSHFYPTYHDRTT